MKNVTSIVLVVLSVLLWSISPGQWTIDTANTSVGFTPHTPRVVQPGVAYSQTVQVFIPTTYSGINIDSIHIDSIGNVPAGLAYVLNPVTGTVPGNGNGAFCFSGVSTATPGPYVLNFIGSLYSGTAVIPLSEVAGQLGYKLRVEVAPVAAFAADSPSCAGIDSVTLTDQTYGYPTSWTWTISGGSPGTSNLQNPLVKFDSAGTYTVKLVAKNSIASDSITQTIVVNPSPAGSVLTTPASGSTAANGSAVVILTGGTPPYSYLWSTNAVMDSISDELPGTYWVLANDDKGCQYVNDNVTISFASGIQPLTSAAMARVYPNPASDVLNLEWLQKSNAEVVAYDMNGKAIRNWTANFDGHTTLNISGLAAGPYLLRITDKTGNRQQALLFSITPVAGE